MNSTCRVKVLAGCAVAVLALRPQLLHACAACYGQSDAPMAHGMNWGIASLLVIITMVLASVAGFFVYLAKRAAAFQSAGLATAGTPPN